MVNKKEIATLNGLLYLYAISKAKSKRRVSETLGISTDTLNKYIADLEAEMKTHFLVSSGRGTVITPEGERILRIANIIVKALRRAGDYADTATSCRGTVRLGMPDAIVDYIGSEKLNDFYRQYPGIQIENTIRHRLPDMASMEADIGLSYDPPAEDDLVLIRVKKVKCGLYASQKYLSEFGVPKNMKNLLEKHRICDKHNHPMYVDGWEELMSKAQHIVYKTDSIFALRQVLEEGVGVGICPVDYGENRLVRVLKKEFEFYLNIYLIAHKDTKDMPRIRVVLDRLIEVLDSKYIDEGK